MMSFQHKKSPIFRLYDILCRDILLSLHFLFPSFLWINDCANVGVSLQNHRGYAWLKKLFFPFKRIAVFLCDRCKKQKKSPHRNVKRGPKAALLNKII